MTFAADVSKRARQLIFVVREYAPSYTPTCLVEDERCHTIRSALTCLCVELLPFNDPLAIVRTNAAPGFAALVDDKLLRHHRITIEIGRVKNTNKNPSAENAIRELEDELIAT
ncbi:hypothetical protein NP493_530g01054 [Ridgeia piscesae]|uniref:Uncharacterized protein n=1 Tax=Ridgeia piscesae TaxID=27915 RepID=A0AAD9KXV5_RIDPI|nr:hypothetical protein NP493_530g01054 [Ridgeia piscesae]